MTEPTAWDLALAHERELRERLERRVDRMENLDKVKMVGFIVVGLLLSGMPQFVPLFKALLGA